jgi:hypothetical protein
MMISSTNKLKCRICDEQTVEHRCVRCRKVYCNYCWDRERIVYQDVVICCSGCHPGGEMRTFTHAEEALGERGLFEGKMETYHLRNTGPFCQACGEPCSIGGIDRMYAAIPKGPAVLPYGHVDPICIICASIITVSYSRTMQIPTMVITKLIPIAKQQQQQQAEGNASKKVTDICESNRDCDAQNCSGVNLRCELGDHHIDCRGKSLCKFVEFVRTKDAWHCYLACSAPGGRIDHHSEVLFSQRYKLDI